MNDKFEDDIEIIDDFDVNDDNVKTDSNEESENEKKLMETLNLAEILDPNLAVPKEEPKVEKEEVVKKQGGQKSAVFIAILFGLLILFIILLPYITKMIQK